MNPVIKNILAVVAGIIVGSLVNMAIIFGGMAILPLPEGVTMADLDDLKAVIHLFKPIHFISPFLAHALGTLVGALIASVIAASSHRTFALVIGLWFLLGGIANIFMIGAPVWFAAVDLILAYIPFALMGWWMVKK